MTTPNAWPESEDSHVRRVAGHAVSRRKRITILEGVVSVAVVLTLWLFLFAVLWAAMLTFTPGVGSSRVGASKGDDNGRIGSALSEHPEETHFESK